MSGAKKPTPQRGCLPYTTVYMNSITHQAPVLLSDVPLMALFLQNHVHAGFPSPAEDLGAQRIDLTKMLVVHPQATYFMRARGDSMKEAGIFDNDILLVDRAVRPQHNHIVIATVDGEFTVKRLYQLGGRIKLKAANPTFPEIAFREGQELVVWGVVRCSITQFPI